MYCKNCNSVLDKNAKFCPHCGTPCFTVTPTYPKTGINVVTAHKRNKKLLLFFIIVLTLITGIILTVSFFVNSGRMESTKYRRNTDYSQRTYGDDDYDAANINNSASFTPPAFPKIQFSTAPVEDFEFDETNRFSTYHGHRSISGYNGSDTGYIRLPSSDNTGGKVTAIDTLAFCGSSIKGVLIPDGIVVLAYKAFYECDNLEVVEFEGNIEIIDGSFRNCTALKNIKLPLGLTKLESFTFDGCTSLTYVELPDSLQEIEDWAISNCGNNVTVKIPASVTSIHEDAFDDSVTIVAEPGSYAEEYARQRQNRAEEKKNHNHGNSGNEINPNITYPDYNRTELECPICGGTGEVECRVCGGDGIVVERTHGTGSNTWIEEVRCTNCHNGQMQCPGCWGSGKVQ